MTVSDREASRTGIARTLTDVGPTLLVPAAWTVTVGAHAGAVSRRAVLVALLVMDVLLVAFYLLAREEMTGPVLGLWRRVLVAGFVATLAGTVDMVALAADPLLPLVVLAWMVLPGVAYLLTGRAVETTPYRAVYFAGGVLSLVGALVYLAWAVGGLLAGGTVTATGGLDPTVVVGVALVGVGQTAGIVAAAVQNT